MLANRLHYVKEMDIHFEMKLPLEEPTAYSSLTKEQFDTEIEKGIEDMQEGKVYLADTVENELRRDFGI